MRVFRHASAPLSYLEAAPDDPRPELPLIVGLHGRGANGNDLLSLAEAIAPGAFRWVLPNAPQTLFSGPYGTGLAWYEIGRGAEDIPASRQALMALLEQVSRQYATPPERTALLGFSQGAVMALNVGLGSGLPLGAIVALSGFLHAPDDTESFAPGAELRTVFLGHGLYDDIFPIERARQVHQTLREHGLEPEYREFESGHEIPPEAVSTVEAFLMRRLLGL